MPGMGPTISEYESGELHSGSKNGPVVKNRKQAIAIGLSEQRKAASSDHAAMALAKRGAK